MRGGLDAGDPGRGGIADRCGGTDREFLENLAVDSLLALAGEAGQALLRGLTVFEVPAPETVAGRLEPHLGGSLRHLRDGWWMYRLTWWIPGGPGIARGNPGLQDLIGRKLVLSAAVGVEYARQTLDEMEAWLAQGDLPSNAEVRGHPRQVRTGTDW